MAMVFSTVGLYSPLGYSSDQLQEDSFHVSTADFLDPPRSSWLLRHMDVRPLDVGSLGEPWPCTGPALIDARPCFFFSRMYQPIVTLVKLWQFVSILFAGGASFVSREDEISMLEWSSGQCGGDNLCYTLGGWFGWMGREGSACYR